ncbi:hypothetical protein D7X25_24290 [bacterium 1XD42-8]|nr:hypothetical protein D7X25_24290 [bacterium 1XD42-8]
MNDMIDSASFKEKYCIEKTAFTRNRKLSFQDILYFMLGMPQKSLTTEKNLCFGKKTIFISKKTFAKARYKISPLAFEDIFNLSTDLFGLQTIPRHETDTVYLPLTVWELPLATIKTTRRNWA